MDIEERKSTAAHPQKVVFFFTSHRSQGTAPLIKRWKKGGPTFCGQIYGHVNVF
jgi:hypothetical protein